MMSTAFWLIVALTAQVSLLVVTVLLVQSLALRTRPRESSRLFAFSSLLMLLLSVAIILPLPSWFSAEGEQESDSVSSWVVDEDNAIVMGSLFNVDQFESNSANSLPAITLSERIRNLSKQIDEPESHDRASGTAWLLSLIHI